MPSLEEPDVVVTHLPKDGGIPSCGTFTENSMMGEWNLQYPI